MIIEYVQDKQCILLKINIRASDVQTFTYALNYATKILRKIDQIYFERGFYESELLISGRSNDVENLSSYRYIFVFAMEKLVFEPSTVAYSAEGQLAVGFKSGGLLVYPSYESLPMGALCCLQVSWLSNTAHAYNYNCITLLPYRPPRWCAY